MGCVSGHPGGRHGSWESPAADGWGGGQERQPRQAGGDWNAAAQGSDWNAAAAPGRDPAAAGSEQGGRRRERKPSERRERKPRSAGQRTEGGEQGDGRCSSCPLVRTVLSRQRFLPIPLSQIFSCICLLIGHRPLKICALHCLEMGATATPGIQGSTLSKACHAWYNSCSRSRHHQYLHVVFLVLVYSSSFQLLHSHKAAVPRVL